MRSGLLLTTLGLFGTASASAVEPLCSVEDIRHVYARDFVPHVWSCIECKGDVECSIPNSIDCIHEHTIPVIEGATSQLSGVYRIGEPVQLDSSTAFNVEFTRHYEQMWAGKSNFLRPNYLKPLQDVQGIDQTQKITWHQISRTCASELSYIYHQGLMKFCADSDEIQCKKELRIHTSEKKGSNNRVVDSSYISDETVRKVHQYFNDKGQSAGGMCIYYDKKESYYTELAAFPVLPTEKRTALDLTPGGESFEHASPCANESHGLDLVQSTLLKEKALKEAKEKLDAALKKIDEAMTETDKTPPPTEAQLQAWGEFLVKLRERDIVTANYEAVSFKLQALNERIFTIQTNNNELSAKVDQLKKEADDRRKLDDAAALSKDPQLDQLTKKVRDFVATYADSQLFQMVVRVTGNTAYYKQRGFHQRDDCDKYVDKGADPVSLSMAAAPAATSGPNVEESKSGCQQRKTEFDAHQKGLVEMSNFVKAGDKQALGLRSELDSYKKANAKDTTITPDEKEKRAQQIDRLIDFAPTDYQVSATTKINQWQQQLHADAGLQVERELAQRQEAMANTVMEETLASMQDMMEENERLTAKLEQELIANEKANLEMEAKEKELHAKVTELNKLVEERKEQVKRLQELDNDPRILQTFGIAGGSLVGCVLVFLLYFKLKNCGKK